ncbi:serine/threonine protein phosphatase PrpC [Thermocatellispora tengchongensis]|uniref:Serine/threonine protein phosphatase PrpC n=1 Tax=Thermocatellispora tengchongensis TaxID=1073253 RepID=A0A840PLZ5_9ACTN|nr:protein phosphatase 2C domain-containing protein [Thermocatellispora tengchongensis]MBB5140102.1 serine/threonine protein phosphatase PrpC [Thermocatellispora tengchongensis]
MTAEMTATCPHCAYPVLQDETFCEECGRAIHAGTPGACASCGAGASEVGADGYCGRCGVRQPAPRDHLEVETGSAAGVSDRGLRHSRNEDSMALMEVDEYVTVGVVCDGVSSSPRPDNGSQAAAETGAATLVKELRAGAGHVEATRAAVARAAEAIAALGTYEDAPACTYVSAIVAPGRVTIGWVGDSRAYWLGPRPVRLTSDDATETGMLTAWLGADAGEVIPQVSTFEPDTPGVVLVCSDGLWNYLPTAEEMAAAAPGAATAPLATAQALVRHALESGGRDNITVLVIPYGRGSAIQ